MLAALNAWAFAPPAEREPHPEPKPEPEPSPRYGLNSVGAAVVVDWSVAYIADFATSYSYSYQAELDAEMSLAMARDEVPLPSYLYDDDGTALSSYSYDLEHRYNLYNADGTPCPPTRTRTTARPGPPTRTILSTVTWYLAGQESEGKRAKNSTGSTTRRCSGLKSPTPLQSTTAPTGGMGAGAFALARPETHHGDQHGWAGVVPPLGEMQRKQQAEIEARLQASRVEKFFVEISRLWAGPQAEPDAEKADNAEAAKQDTTPMTLEELTQWYQDCVNAGSRWCRPTSCATTATAVRSACQGRR